MTLAWLSLGALVAAMCLVDMSPLSTTGAMCIAGISDVSQVRPTYNKLLAWGLSMTLVGAFGCWLAF